MFRLDDIPHLAELGSSCHIEAINISHLAALGFVCHLPAINISHRAELFASYIELTLVPAVLR